MHTFIEHRKDWYTVGYASAEFKREVDRVIGWYPIEDVKKMVCILNGGTQRL